MMNEPQFDSRISRFFERLATLRPGERARFKRNAGKTLAESHHAALGLFYRVLPPGVPIIQEETYYLAATLYPLAKDGAKGDFGYSLHRARVGENKAGLDRRVEILLDADESQLSFRLRQALRYLVSNEVHVNWPMLLRDLLAWSHPQRYVQERWARGYFAGQIEQ